MIGLIANAPEDELPELHRRLLIAERDRLWKEVQQDAQETYEKGGFAAVPELIRDYRNRNRPE
ncbi:MAG: hypothetical protein KDL87_01365 [Verrucomicrobiae bacterium]|nr:hypothetical protein [Verrucomicrobiae bacterium]